jgi:hypothetical protein
MFSILFYTFSQIAEMNNTIFCEVWPYRLVEVYRRFGGFLYPEEATVRSPKTSANLYRTRRRNFQEYSALHSYRRENLKFQFLEKILRLPDKCKFIILFQMTITTTRRHIS